MPIDRHAEPGAIRVACLEALEAGPHGGNPWYLVRAMAAQMSTDELLEFVDDVESGRA